MKKTIKGKVDKALLNLMAIPVCNNGLAILVERNVPDNWPRDGCEVEVSWEEPNRHLCDKMSDTVTLEKLFPINMWLLEFVGSDVRDYRVVFYCPFCGKRLE